MKKLKIVELETEGELTGAWIIKIKNKKESDKVLVRSDGTSTYIAKDIVLASWKIGLIKDIFKEDENFKIQEQFKEIIKDFPNSKWQIKTLSGENSKEKIFNIKKAFS